MIHQKLTKDKFGYDPFELSLGSPKTIVYICDKCQKPYQCARRKYKDGKICLLCTHAKKRITKTELAQEIHQIIDNLGYQPTEDEYLRIAGRSTHTLTKVFGLGWREILVTLGYKVKKRVNDPLSYTDVYNDIKLVEKKIGRIPNTNDYRQHGKYTSGCCIRSANCNTWDELISKIYNIHLSVVKQHYKTHYKPLEYHLQRIRQLTEEIGRPPTQKEANSAGISPHQLKKRLNTDWIGILKHIGLDYTKLPQNSKNSLLPKDLIGDIKRIAKMLGRPPLAKDYNQHGKYALATVRKHFGQPWNSILKTVGLSTPIKETHYPSMEQIIDDLKRLSQNGLQVTKRYYEIHGKFSVHLALKGSGFVTWNQLNDHIFGSFARYEPIEYYFNKLRDLAKNLGHAPSQKQATDILGINPTDLKKRLNLQWPEIIKLAGIDPDTLSKRVTTNIKTRQKKKALQTFQELPPLSLISGDNQDEQTKNIKQFFGS